MATSKRAAPEDIKEKKPPVSKFSVGSTHFAIWANEGHDGQGEIKTYYNVTHERNYEVEQGSEEWKKTTQVRESDLGNVIAGYQRALQIVSALKERAKAEAKTA